MAGEELIYPLLGGVLLLAIAYYFMRVRGGYKVRVIMWEKRGNSYIKHYDKAKRIREKNGETYYKLKKGKPSKIRPPPYSSVNMTDNSKTNEIEFYSPMPGQFVPIKFEEGTLKPIDVDVEFWRGVEVEKEQLRFQKQGVFEKYAWLMAIVIVMISMGVTMYMVYDGIAKVASSNAGISEQNAKMLATYQKMVTGGQITLPTGNSGNPLPPIT